VQLGFLKLPEAERRVYINEAAARRGLSPVILEKDFWVCWLLGVLFGSKFSHELVFKGGTSLSKVFGVIQRFSEDIDLSLAPEFLNLGEPGTSRSQADKWMKNAEAKCAQAVRDNIEPELERTIAAVLGAPQNRWLEFMTDPNTKSPVLLFHYPTTQPEGFAYLKRSVKLEFGSLTDQRPVGQHAIRPWLADEFQDAFADWQCKIVALELERSFWEKATILHAEHFRPAEKPPPDRFSRHYADTAALATHPIATQAIAQTELRDRVVDWKSQFFGSSWARYDLAKPKTFKLVPPREREAPLSRDYDAMRDMYLGEPMKFDKVLSKLAELEDRINRA
jgi:Nucleotidyl transferase AbiEii toxin, Type IV TA system